MQIILVLNQRSILKEHISCRSQTRTSPSRRKNTPTYTQTQSLSHTLSLSHTHIPQSILNRYIQLYVSFVNSFFVVVKKEVETETERKICRRGRSDPFSFVLCSRIIKRECVYFRVTFVMSNPKMHTHSLYNEASAHGVTWFVVLRSVFGGTKLTKWFENRRWSARESECMAEMKKHVSFDSHIFYVSFLSLKKHLTISSERELELPVSNASSAGWSSK